jgi:hypothetical protein
VVATKDVKPMMRRRQQQQTVEAGGESDDAAAVGYDGAYERGWRPLASETVAADDARNATRSTEDDGAEAYDLL